MAADPPAAAAVEPGRARPRLSDRALTLLVATLLLVLLATVLGGWLTLRSPGLDPVSIPTVSQA